MAETRSRSSGTASGRARQSGSGRTADGQRSTGRERSRDGDAASRAKPARSRSSRSGQAGGAAARGASGAAQRETAGRAGALGAVGRFTIKRVAVPLASAAVGAVAATALEQRRLSRRRKVLGIPLPRPRSVDLNGLGKGIGEAGKQLGKLADEVRQSREKAEQVGKALS